MNKKRSLIWCLTTETNDDLRGKQIDKFQGTVLSLGSSDKIYFLVYYVKDKTKPVWKRVDLALSISLYQHVFPAFCQM